jgi:hypothetical protein
MIKQIKRVLAPEHAPVDLVEVVVRLAGLCRRGHEHIRDALEVLDPERSGLDRITVADGLGEISGIRSGCCMYT